LPLGCLGLWGGSCAIAAMQWARNSRRSEEDKKEEELAQTADREAGEQEIGRQADRTPPRSQDWGDPSERSRNSEVAGE
jgi:hypothetical protein